MAPLKKWRVVGAGPAPGRRKQRGVLGVRDEPGSGKSVVRISLWSHGNLL